MVQGEIQRRLPEGVFSLSPRCQLMVEVTCDILQSDPELRLCEGLRLIDATRTAILRCAPETLTTFDSELAPHMRAILLERFGVRPLPTTRFH